ncbi:MAG: hypothetical protein NTU98_09215 [Bacteroidetes bacterium]|nr:hypothetical protein [Bacteroidota bacterium]
MKKAIFTWLAFAAMILLFNSCSKDGATGPAGTNGNTNVHSKTFVVNPSDWNVNSTNLTRFLTDSAITQDIIDNGSVEMFVNYGDSWRPLPFTNFWAPSPQTYQGSFYLNEFDIFVWRNDGLQPIVPGVLTFKVVTIAGSAKTANPNINWKNYEEVKKAFNLKD